MDIGCHTGLQGDLVRVENVVMKPFYILEHSYHHRDIAPVPQRHMEDGSVLSKVDLLSTEHRLPGLLQPSLPGKVHLLLGLLVLSPLVLIDNYNYYYL